MIEAGAKAAAYEFLQSLESALDRGLSPHEKFPAKVDEAYLTGKNDPSRKHWGNNPEAAFLNAFVIKLLFEHMQTVPGITADVARLSLLADYARCMPEFTLQGTSRSISHPFGKDSFKEKSSETYARWSGKIGNFAIKSYPDYAFRRPFPHKILFEGKYFKSGDGEEALVDAIRETYFYLGLPFVPATSEKPAWDYDYACLIAYDASPRGALRKAWEDLEPRSRFWSDANIYIILLGGNCRRDAIGRGAPETQVSRSIASTASFERARPVITSAKYDKSALVEFHFPDAIEGKTAIIARWKEKEYWFSKEKIKRYWLDPCGGYSIVAPYSEFSSRGIVTRE